MCWMGRIHWNRAAPTKVRRMTKQAHRLAVVAAESRTMKMALRTGHRTAAEARSPTVVRRMRAVAVVPKAARTLNWTLALLRKVAACRRQEVHTKRRPVLTGKVERRPLAARTLLVPAGNRGLRHLALLEGIHLGHRCSHLQTVAAGNFRLEGSLPATGQRQGSSSLQAEPP